MRREYDNITILEPRFMYEGRWIEVIAKNGKHVRLSAAIPLIIYD